MVVLKNGGNPHVIKLLDYFYNEIVVHDTRGSTLKELANQVEEEVGRGTHLCRFIEDLFPR